MAALEDVMAYIIKNYPHQNEMSNARLTKTIYLSDWHHTAYHSKRLTSINWYFDSHGPFVWDIKDMASEKSEYFRIAETNNFYGSKKLLIQLIKRSYDFSNLSKIELSSMDRIIELTKSMYWDDFITFVYSTFPVMNSEKFSEIDLERIAVRFREEKNIKVAA